MDTRENKKENKMNLEDIVNEQNGIHHKTGFGHVSEVWTWKLYMGEEIVQTEQNVMSPKACLDVSFQEWENVRGQGCTKLEIVRNCDNTVVKIYQ